MKKNNISKFAIPVLLIASLTECTTVLNSTAYADFLPTTQTLRVPDKAFNIIDIAIEERKFYRTVPSIIETEPWLNPKNKNKTLSDDQLIDILKNAGFSGNNLEMAWAIVQKESKSKVYAHNTNRSTGDNSYGLFQINMIDKLGPARLKEYGLSKNEDLFNPNINARVAFEISNGGNNWKAWTTYSSAKSKVAEFPG